MDDDFMSRVVEDKLCAECLLQIILLLEGMPMEEIAKDYEIPIEYIEDMASKLKIDSEQAEKSS